MPQANTQTDKCARARPDERLPVCDTPGVSDRPTCADCHQPSPETETNYTLIGSRFGWRLTRRIGPQGNLLVEWRCAECWRAYKGSRADVVPPSVPRGPGVAHPPSGRRRAVSTAPPDDDPTLREVTTPRPGAPSASPKGTRGRS